MNLRRTGARPLVIGHRGAAAVAPENSREALLAAVASGADAVEFDIAPGLVLGHSASDVAPGALTLDDALEELSGHEIALHLDVKGTGYEDEVLASVRRHGVEDRTYFSTSFAATTRRFRQIAPKQVRAIGYPRDRLGVSGFDWPGRLTAAGAAALRQAMPARIPVLLGWARADALALHHTLCSRAAVATAHRLGAPVLAWTVNDPAGMLRLAALGVDGIVTDDPATAVATLLVQ